MIVPVIKKSREIYYNGEIYLDFADGKKAWFTIKNHNVRFEYGKGYLKTSCDCAWMGKKGIPKCSLCSHILAGFLYIYGKKGVIKK